MLVPRVTSGEPANFLDVGGSAQKDQIAAAFKIISDDARVKVSPPPPYHPVPSPTYHPVPSPPYHPVPLFAPALRRSSSTSLAAS